MIRATADPAVPDMQPEGSQSDAPEAWLRDVLCYATTWTCLTCRRGNSVRRLVRLHPCAAYSGMAGHFPRLDALIRNAEAAAAKEADPLLVLQVLLKMTINSEADAYLLIGQLTEAIAEAVAKRIPTEKQREVSGATFQLLYDRLRAKGWPEPQRRFRTQISAAIARITRMRIAKLMLHQKRCEPSCLLRSISVLR